MNTTGTAVNITGLSPTGEEYTITISAVNIVGAGPAVSVIGKYMKRIIKDCSIYQ